MVFLLRRAGADEPDVCHWGQGSRLLCGLFFQGRVPMGVDVVPWSGRVKLHGWVEKQRGRDGIKVVVDDGEGETNGSGGGRQWLFVVACEQPLGFPRRRLAGNTWHQAGSSKNDADQQSTQQGSPS